MCCAIQSAQITSGMAASRFLAVAAACAILFGFGAENRNSHCNVAARKLRIVLWHQFFFHVGADDFPFSIPFKECFKLVVPPLGRRDPVLELQFV